MRLSTFIGWATIALAVIGVIASFGLPAPLLQAATRTYSGNVLINGSPAPLGTVVSVFVSGQTAPCASTTTAAGGAYTLVVNDTGGNCPLTGSTNTVLFFDVAGPFGQRRVGTDVFTGSGTPTLNLEYNWHQITGSVSVGGTAPAVGASVAAFIGTHTEPCTVADVTSGGFFSMAVVRGVVGAGGNQPTECHDGIAASPISFRVNNTPVTGITVNFSPGANTTGVFLALAEAGHRVRGTAMVNSSLLTGTTVQALIGSTVCGTATTDNSGQFDLDVAPVSQTPGCGTNGQTVNFRVAGQPVPQTITFQSGGHTPGLTLTLGGTPTPTPTATPTPTPTATPTPTPTATPTPTPTPTLTPRPGTWVDRPPTTPNAIQTCPAADQWLLLYWNGDTPIATAANACLNADIFWVNRSGRWLGFAKGAPGASDTWEVIFGEAHFVHGR